MPGSTRPRSPSSQHTRNYLYQRLAAEHRARSADSAQPCWLCRQPIDYTLPADNPDAYSTDHVIPVSQRPDLACDPSNFAPSHLRCNKSRGNQPPRPHLGQPSQHW